MNAARLAWRGLATSASPHPGSGAAFAPAALPAHVLAHAPLFAWPLCFRGASMSTWTVIPPCRAARLRTQPLLIRGLAASAAPSGSGGAGTSAGRRSPITFHSMLLGMGAFLGVVALAQNRAQQKVEGMMQRSQEVVGRASVGGPFELIDQDGKRFTHENLLGGFSVLYFGFTHCPDICPDELEKLAVALDIIERNNGGYKVRQPRHPAGFG
jgi:SCO1/SenC